ncbi:(2Fe-2S)-binding protein [Aquabacterium humicola]|uniref:(2Fe-2S)-binding protein n=1 Tax=Aquabacterium humicola TaxID=3237377 RepID=UPI002542A2E0|nr:2Fe-2S iron-sulfur cluster-binding protein [Rubrivivax pictus]
MLSYTLNVNGKDHVVEVRSAEMPLLWVLRDLIGLTGTKYGCGIEVCGACTVWVDGEPKKSCDMDVSSAAGRRITTIEGLSPDRSHPAQVAWIKHQVPQCGFCQSGVLMRVAGAMRAGHHGSEIAGEIENVCVCGTYQRMKRALADL